MAYTREINLDADTEQRLIQYIEDELSRHYAERGDWIRQIENWQIDYNAEPSQVEGTWPFKGSATLIIPLAAITAEAIHARTMTTAFALSQFISAKPVSSQWAEHARPLERFLDQEFEKIDIHKAANSSILEIIKYGTGVIQTGYCNITKTAVREIGDKEEEFTYTVKRGATVEAVPIGRFLMPHVYQNPQTASWCGREHSFTPYEVRLNEIGGLFKPGTVEKLSVHFTKAPNPEGNSGSETEDNQAELEKRPVIWPYKVDTVELWMGFDIDGSEKLYNDGILQDEHIINGFDKEIVVHYHRESRTILSCRYNPNPDLRRPFHTGVYFPVEHRWPGIGVCKQVEQFQREITTQHRQRIDNATLANCRMLKVSDLSKYGPDEPIFPGKMWFVSNKDDIDSFALGEIYPSSYSNENQSLLFLQQRTGVNEVNLGMPQVGTPGTATSDLARIQEGNKKYDYTYGNIKRFLNEVVRSTVLNIKQHGPRGALYYETVENGALVKEFFDQDFELIKQSMLVEISIAGQQDNKLLDRQNMQQVAQLLTGYYESAVALAQMKGDPVLMQQVVDNALRASTEVMKQILESFDLKNVDRIVLNEVLNARPSQAAPAGPIAGSNGAGPSSGIQLPNQTIPATSY
jgi:hypothetical protein